MDPLPLFKDRHSLYQIKPIVMEDRIWWHLVGVDSHDVRIVFNWGSGRIYVYDQTTGKTLLEK